MVGNIKLEEFKGTTKFPQKAASAWSFLDGIVGVGLKPLLYLGSQLVNGTNYWFVAERTTVTLEPKRNVVLIGVNESLKGEYSIVKPVQVLA